MGTEENLDLMCPSSSFAQESVYCLTHWLPTELILSNLKFPYGTFERFETPSIVSSVIPGLRGSAGNWTLTNNFFAVFEVGIG